MLQKQHLVPWRFRSSRNLQVALCLVPDNHRIICSCISTSPPFGLTGLVYPSFSRIHACRPHSNTSTGPRRVCQRLQKELVASDAEDYSRSGTTLCAAVLIGRRLTVANVGDSGCLRISRVPGNSQETSSSNRPVGETTGDTKRRPGGGAPEARQADGIPGQLVVQRITRDHKPELEDELKRIRASGGIVFPLQGKRSDACGVSRGAELMGVDSRQGRSGGPRSTGLVRDFAVDVPRVWRAGSNGPGLAMSRSIGDEVLETLKGVVLLFTIRMLPVT